MIAYKLLSQSMLSYNNTVWEIGVKKSIPEENRKPVLCSSGVFHCYADPTLAILLNPLHANIKNPRLFKIEIDAVVVEDRTKQGSYTQTLLEELDVPKITPINTVAFAILCAKEVYKEHSFIVWADLWLAGVNREKTDADAAAAAANAATTAATTAYAYSSAYAAIAAAYAADAAAAYTAGADVAISAAYTADAAIAAAADTASAAAAAAAADTASAAAAASDAASIERKIQSRHLLELLS